MQVVAVGVRMVLSDLSMGRHNFIIFTGAGGLGFAIRAGVNVILLMARMDRIPK